MQGSGQHATPPETLSIGTPTRPAQNEVQQKICNCTGEGRAHGVSMPQDEGAKEQLQQSRLWPLATTIMKEG